jgi:hypothetical protein
MSLTLNLNPAEEQALRTVAEQSGRNLEGVIRDVLRERVPGFSTGDRSREEELLLQLSRGLPEQTWRRFDELRLKLEAEQATNPERDEFLELNRKVETWNVERLRLVEQIAQLRGISFDTALSQLGQVRN